MKKLFIFLTLFSACTFQEPIPKEETTEEPADESPADAESVGETEVSIRLDADRCYENDAPIVVVDNEDFRETDQGTYGQFSMEGVPVRISEEAPFSGEPIESVYLVTKDDASLSFQYYRTMALEGNSINFIQDEELYFKLGALENGGLKTSASMDEDTQEQILSAMETGESITLTMLQAVEMGRGGSQYSVFPCLID